MLRKPLLPSNTRHQRSLASEDKCSPFHRLVERAYRYRPIKVVEFELPRQQCIVYLDLKREECLNLFPAGRVYSQAFHLGGQGFFLSAHCNMDQQSSFHCFGLFLGMQEKGSVTSTNPLCKLLYLTLEMVNQSNITHRLYNLLQIILYASHS